MITNIAILLTPFLILIGLGFFLIKGICWIFSIFNPRIDNNLLTGNINIQTIGDEIPNNINKNQSITLKEPKFNSSQINDYQTSNFKSFEFRPESWNQFIGQEEAKNRAQTIIKKAMRGIKCHFLVNGIRGHGKTSFVELIAKSLGAKLIERVGKQLDEESLLEVINEINTSKDKYVIFFIDEIDTMDWKILKILNPIIEQFKINEKNIKPFIFAGATINKHVLVKNNPDTLDRISTHIKFERYSSNHIYQILLQYRFMLYPNDRISKEVIAKISKNCKFNPRTSIALLEEFIVENDINNVFKNCNIITHGLTKTDIDILKVLQNSSKPLGANCLAMKAKLSQKEYEREYEPFLVEYDFINRVPSRIITKKGIKILEE